MSILMSSVISRPSILDSISSFYDDEVASRGLKSKLGMWADVALEKCMTFAEQSCSSEPHFHWVDAVRVELVPSDYQFTILDHRNSDLVLIEEDDLVLRSYCEAANMELELYRDFQEGWDGEDMPAPLHASIDDAFTFLRLLSNFSESCVEAIPMLDHEGISSIAFENKTDYLSIAFYGDNRVVAYRWNNPTNSSSVIKSSLADIDFLHALILDIEKL